MGFLDSQIVWAYTDPGGGQASDQPWVAGRGVMFLSPFSQVGLASGMHRHQIGTWVYKFEIQYVDPNLRPNL